MPRDATNPRMRPQRDHEMQKCNDARKEHRQQRRPTWREPQCAQAAYGGGRRPTRARAQLYDQREYGHKHNRPTNDCRPRAREGNAQRRKEKANGRDKRVASYGKQHRVAVQRQSTSHAQKNTTSTMRESENAPPPLPPGCPAWRPAAAVRLLPL